MPDPSPAERGQGSILQPHGSSSDSLSMEPRQERLMLEIFFKHEGLFVRNTANTVSQPLELGGRGEQLGSRCLPVCVVGVGAPGGRGGGCQGQLAVRLRPAWRGSAKPAFLLCFSLGFHAWAGAALLRVPSWPFAHGMYFTKIQGFRSPGIGQVCWRRFSSRVCSCHVSVSHLGDSH